MAGAMRCAIAHQEPTVVVADRAPKKIIRHGHQTVGSNPFRSSSIRKLCWRSGMENSRYRWVIVAAGGLLGCVAIGGMFSLPVLLQPITRDTGWSGCRRFQQMCGGFL